MFSLVISIVSIALVAVLALATLYYGGKGFTQGTAKANASRLLNEGQQLMGAAELYRHEHGRYPDNIEQLISGNYLKTRPPGGSASAVTSVFANIEQWSMPEPGTPVFETTTEGSSTCRAVNESSYGLDGILTEMRPNLISQCYGSDADTLTTVYSKGWDALVSVTSYSTSLTTEPIPEANNTTAWLVPPSITASAVLPAYLSTTPNDLPDFGALQVGESATSASITVSNTGGTTATGLSFTTPEGFSVTNNSCTSTLDVGAQCSFTVFFEPAAHQSYSGNLVLSSDSPLVYATLALRGEGQLPAATLSVPVFSPTPTGQSSVADAVLTNTGLSFLSLTVPGPGSVQGQDFAFDSTNCQSFLASGSSCQVRVRFTPSAATLKTGSLQVSTAAGTLTAALQAQGVQATLQLNPSAIEAFGDVTVGQSSSVVTVSVTNIGQASAQGVTITAPMGYTLESNTCSPSVTLAAGSGSCSFGLRFVPPAFGDYAGIVTVATPSGVGASLAVSGQGVGSQATLESGSLAVAFPTVSVGAAAPTKPLVFRNTGNQAMTLGVSGVDTSKFSVVGNTCISAAPGTTCTVTLSMLTNQIGAMSDPSFTISGATSGALSGSLYGVVQGVSATWGTSSYAFGDVTTGASASFQVNITNTGNVTANFNAQSATAGSISGFSFSGCPSVAPGATCPLTITFSPPAAGSYSASVRPSEASGGSALSLTGTGLAPPGVYLNYSGAGTIRYGTGVVTVPMALPNGGTVNFYEYLTAWAPRNMTDEGTCKFHGNIGYTVHGMWLNIDVDGRVVSFQLNSNPIVAGTPTQTIYNCDWGDPRSFPTSRNGSWRTWISATKP